MGEQYLANWYADPTGRHQLRYHNGIAWTEHVSDNGQQSTDPVEATTPVATTTPAVVDSHGIEAAKAKMRIRFGAGREIKKLPQHLWDDETVELLSSGNVSERNGLLALTSHRLIFLFAGLVNSAFEDFPISNISSISYKSGMALASIEVYASGNKATIKNVNKADAKEIADAIRAKLGRPAAATTVQAASSDADELAKWARLRDSGVISAEDFEAKKRQLLGLER
jgi:Bacterial PH domain/Protein of unknown function (DUF2510)/Short C-terminal domain